MDLSPREREICREILSGALALLSQAEQFKNREKWEALPELLSGEERLELDSEQLKLLLSAFNMYYLLSQKETDKLSRYLKSNLHQPEDMAAYFERARAALGENPLEPEACQLLRRRLSAALKDFSSARRFLPRKLYISDLHFYHGNLNFQMDQRGFGDEAQMNARMIRQWQEHVHEKDEVYVLGDFCMGTGEMANIILRQLPGKKYLIIGNHDRYLEDRAFDASLFQWAKPYAEIQDRHRRVILSHYPVFCYNGQYKVDGAGNPKAYMLYGHVHNTLDEALVNAFIRQTRAAKRPSRYEAEPRPIPCNMINCFCMFSDYIPLTLEEWILTDERRRKEMEDVPDSII